MSRMSKASAIYRWRAAPSVDEELMFVSSLMIPLEGLVTHWNLICCASFALLLTWRISSSVTVGGIGLAVSTITTLLSSECPWKREVGGFFILRILIHSWSDGLADAAVAACNCCLFGPGLFTLCCCSCWPSCCCCWLVFLLPFVAGG